MQVPEKYRLFAEHRVRVERELPRGPRRQGRTEPPPSLIPDFIKSPKEFFFTPGGSRDVDDTDDKDASDANDASGEDDAASHDD